MTARKIDYSYTFFPYGDDAVKVAINPDHYEKTVKVILTCRDTLRAAIPFDHVDVDEPSIVIYGGRHKKGVLGLEIVVRPTKISRDEAIQLLRTKGFREENEFTLG